MQYPHTLTEVAALVPVPAGELRQLAGRWVTFAGEYDPLSGRVSDRGRDLLLAEYTDDQLENHPDYEPGNRLFQTAGGGTTA